MADGLSPGWLLLWCRSWCTITWLGTARLSPFPRWCRCFYVSCFYLTWRLSVGGRWMLAWNRRIAAVTVPLVICSLIVNASAAGDESAASSFPARLAGTATANVAPQGAGEAAGDRMGGAAGAVGRVGP